MANKKPGFITGANAKIKMFGNTIAFVTDISYNVEVQTIPVEAMGRYEAYSNEPVGYAVSGGFSVIRYTPYAFKADTSTAPDADDGAGISGTASTGNATSYIAAGSGAAHFDPSQILQSYTFDLEIQQKISNTQAYNLVKIVDCRMTRRGMTLNKRGVWIEQYGYIGLLLQDVDSAGTGFINSESGLA